MKRLLMLIPSAFMFAALVWGGGEKDRKGGFSPIDDIPPAADELSLEEAIEQSARDIAEKLPKGSPVTVVGFSSEHLNLSLYIQEELTGALVDAGIKITDRRNMELLSKELKFQMSGDVQDETAVSIGKFVGAQYVITGQLVKTGNIYRYRLAAINVETAIHESSTRLNIRNDRNFRNLLAGVQSPQTALGLDPSGQEEYTLYYSGSLRGFVTIQRDKVGKITVTSKLIGSGSHTIIHEICPLIPMWTVVFVDSSKDDYTQVIDGNTFTITNPDGSWYKEVVDGNTFTTSRSDGFWTKRVVDGNTTIEMYYTGGWTKWVVDGNTTTATDSGGPVFKIVINGNTTTYTDSRSDYWSKTVVDGNTRTVTDSGGWWRKTVVDGNTTIETYSTGYWEKTVVDSNITTYTNSSGHKEVIDKQGYDIFITYETGA
jgi:hypothetical protein